MYTWDLEAGSERNNDRFRKTDLWETVGFFMFDSCEKDCEMVSTCERDAKTGETGKAGSFHTLPHLEVICGQKESTP